jgi:hypothetical protein
MRFFLAAVLAAFVAAACATDHKPKERAIQGDIVVANEMCGGYAVRAATNDKPGDRMICGWEEFVGSHVPRCVCHDEKQMQADRDLAQQYLRDVEMGRCVSNGSGDCRQ